MTKNQKFHPVGENKKGNLIARQKVKNFNLGILNKTKVTASSGLILIMSFAKEIGLAAEVEKRLSHIKKRKRGYCVSEMRRSFSILIYLIFFGSVRPFLSITFTSRNRASFGAGKTQRVFESPVRPEFINITGMRMLSDAQLYLTLI